MHAGKINEQNPLGLNGVDFLEYSGPDGEALDILFRRMGFKEVANIEGKNLRLFRQGDINFILNTEPGTFADGFTKLHGPCAAACGVRVADAEKAFQTAVARGGRPYEGSDAKKGATPFPAIYGIGDSLVYFIDEKNHNRLYNEIFKVKPEDKAPKGVGLTYIDHFTNNVPRGEMDKWCDFYTKVFGFRETRYFDIRGKKTGLLSKVMRSPCGKFSVPINEPTESKSQIQEYLDEYKGSGIQHVALVTENIIDTLETMKSSKIEFLTPPPHTYYAMLNDRVPNVTEEVDRLERNAILVDGDDEGYLLQIFTKNVIGPIFYELIQRNNHFGFGDGNFQALFDAIERDQKERGYL
ncbi:MAG: 4-hydroxyphenylpyruvate dioxygenase [Bdellovibrionaceae bacterium]|nr:4-hydroxyphenylpyruvate dioxygenase [Pseudobdellovibrionaceae bacterium]MBX3032636.1 4-hydroxyphenylpyruvate dioxygenase [Pseudobdellovibrionaceae bacterium]